MTARDRREGHHQLFRDYVLARNDLDGEVRHRGAPPKAPCILDHGLSFCKKLKS
jgi:hypothetical protein